MQGLIVIRCEVCRQKLGDLVVDTADLPDNLQERINKIILAHREGCYYYRTARSPDKVTV